MTHTFIEVSIFFRELMAFKAMRFSFVDCPRTVASQIIFSACNHFKVIWIYAPTFSAKMIYREAVRYFSASPFIRYAMRKTVVVAIKPETRISIIGMAIPYPLPTPSRERLNFSNEFEEAQLGRGKGKFSNDDRIKFCTNERQSMLSVIGILAWYAAVIEAVAGMWQRIKFRDLLGLPAGFACLFHSFIIPEYIRTCNGYAERTALWKRAKEQLT